MAGEENNNPFEKWRPNKTDVSLAEAIEYRRQQYKISRTGVEPQSFDEKFGPERSLVTEIAVAKGEKPVLVVCNFGDQDSTIEHVFNLRPLYEASAESRNILYANVEKVGASEESEAKIVTTRLVWSASGIKPPSPATLIISEGLQKELGVGNGERIRITDIYQDISTINLDDMFGE